MTVRGRDKSCKLEHNCNICAKQNICISYYMHMIKANAKTCNMFTHNYTLAIS